MFLFRCGELFVGFVIGWCLFFADNLTGVCFEVSFCEVVSFVWTQFSVLCMYSLMYIFILVLFVVRLVRILCSMNGVFCESFQRIVAFFVYVLNFFGIFNVSSCFVLIRFIEFFGKFSIGP